jgi:hypothetical protein
VCERYKVEGEVNADPETVFAYIDPSPSSPRAKWDKAIKEIQCVANVAEVIQKLSLVSTCFYLFSTLTQEVKRSTKGSISGSGISIRVTVLLGWVK